MKSLNKILTITVACLFTASLFPMTSKAGIMDDFYEKQSSIRLKGQILEYKVRNFDVDEQLAKYPNKVKDVEIPDDFTVEPFSLDDYNTGHIPEMGEFKSYSDKSFAKSKAAYQSLFNNKKNNLMGQFNQKNNSITNKMNNADNQFNKSKYNLEKEFNDTAKRLEGLFQSKSKTLASDMDKKEKGLAKETQDNYQKEIDNINKMMEKNSVNYWDDEAQQNFDNAKANYDKVKQKVDMDASMVEKLVNDFDKIKADHYAKEQELKSKYENMDLSTEYADWFSRIDADKPAGLDNFIQNTKRQVDSKHNNFTRYK